MSNTTAAYGAKAHAALAATGRETVADAIETVVRSHDRAGFRAVRVTLRDASPVWRHDGTTGTLPGCTVIHLHGSGGAADGSISLLVAVVEANGHETQLGPFASLPEALDAEREHLRQRIECAKRP